MTVIYKVLGQTNPSADTNTTLYTTPANTSTVVSTINVCNQGMTDASFRIAVRPAGEALDVKHYIAYGTTVASSDAISMTMGITLAATDVITVNSNTATLSFSAFGSEIL
jgi:glucose-6-phosphate dehydrogenase assembly protein OpcA